VEEPVTYDDLLQDLVDFMGGPIFVPEAEDGWYTLREISAAMNCHPDFLRPKLQAKVEAGELKVVEYKKTYYYRRVET